MLEGGDFLGVPKKSSSLGMDSFIFLNACLQESASYCSESPVLLEAIHDFAQRFLNRCCRAAEQLFEIIALDIQ